MACLRTVSYTVIINGQPAPPFVAKKGLRQGDPMSPFLSVIAMEYLSRLLRGDTRFISCLHEKFRLFSEASGLVANTNKSAVYFGGVTARVQQQILDILGYSKGMLPFRYLGVPLSSRRVCSPGIAGGLNITSIAHWNKAAACKLLWDLARKKDKLWMQQFSIKAIYQSIKGPVNKVPWYKIVYRNKGAEKWIFTLKMAAHGRLLTRDRLRKWGIDTSPVCPICLLEDETIEQLFFRCNVTGHLWNKLLAWQGVLRQSLDWQGELAWAIEHCKGRSRGAALYKMTLAATIYYVWHRAEEIIIRRIIQEIYYRATMYPKIATYITQFDNYPS
ncbi:uncharacterized protein [Solanum tuberosum]|uniref:uncharacterized protein n=1 Tax=Solanum tuberosum TaxID=4113 RepID=UPI00073A2039|nr:PREDICTED: uncharacterized protein LOC107059721 [Solanum tuberosum]